MVLILKNKNIVAVLIISFCLSACIVNNSREKNFFTAPDVENFASSKGRRTLFITSTNYLEDYKIQVKNSQVFRGGLKILQKYLSILKTVESDLLLLNVGDSFVKGDDFDRMIQFFKNNRYDGIGLSLNDFIYLDKKQKLKKIDLPFISSNLLNIRTQKASLKFPSYKILTKNSLNIALISLVSFIPKTMAKKQRNNLLYFEDPVLNFLRLRQYLQKEKNIDIYIALVSFPHTCSLKNIIDEKKNVPSDRLRCSVKNNHLRQFIMRLPKDKIDLIVSSGSTFAEGFIREIPILQNPGRSQFFSRARIVYDIKTKTILKDQTKILSPVSTCHQFFSATKDCYDHGQTELEVMPAKFLGKILQPDIQKSI